MELQRPALSIGAAQSHISQFFSCRRVISQLSHWKQQSIQTC